MSVDESAQNATESSLAAGVWIEITAIVYTRLPEEQQRNDLVLTGLRHPRVQDEVLARLRARQPVDHIAGWLASTEQQEDYISSSQVAGSRDAAPGPSSPSGDEGLRAGSVVEDNGNPTFGPSSQHNFSAAGQRRHKRGISLDETLQSSSSGLPEPARSRLANWAEARHTDHIVDGTDEPGALHEAVASLREPLLKHAARTWTTVTDDIGLVEHLLGLYFCWEYPTFASLSKEQFLRDFSEGRPRYCSSLLVNALLALGCRFSSFPKKKKKAGPGAPYPSGQQFFDESLELLRRRSDYHSLLVVQALGVLSICEASCGHVMESRAFSGQSMRLAVEMGLHHIVEHPEGGRTADEFSVLSATYWGAFSLEQSWSLATSSPPCFSKHLITPPKPPLVSDIEDSLWVPYTDSGTPPNAFHGQPSHVRSVFKCYCELSELTHQILYLFRSPEQPVTSRRLLDIYTSCVSWFDNVPAALKLGYNFTPAVLFSHMQYHFSILLLFRPFIRLVISGSEIIPKEVCLQSASSINTLLRCYAQLYTLRRTPTFLPQFILASSITLLAIGIMDAHPNADGSGIVIDPSIVDNVQQGMDGLAEIAPCHQFAEQAVNILRRLAQKWNIHLNTDLEPTLDPDTYNDRFVEPYFSGLNLFPDSRPAWSLPVRDAAREVSEEQSRQNQKQEAMDMLENLMLHPIPLQNPSIFLREPGLAKHGFARA
ncbi:hypothetical protein V2A60_006407 [Cordyceps javanica]